MLNRKQFGCLKFLSVNFNDTHAIGKLKSKNFLCLRSKISRQINDIRDTGPDTENTDHGSGYGFLRTACQPIRIENFEKPYNNTIYTTLMDITFN
jgi:hypothetical protein